eukprot:s1974_g2.t1
MGGISVTELPEEVVKVLWRSADQKGSNLPLDTRAAEVLSQHDSMYEQPERSTADPSSEGEGFGEESVPRPIGLRFQFLEVCGGAGKVTEHLIALGVVCGPVFDLSYSKQYNLVHSQVVQWIIFMLEDDRLDSFLVAPPCTSFSAAAHPCVRSYAQPRGFNQSWRKVWLGNRLAFAALTLLYVAWRLRKFGLGETPRRSKMRWLAEWKRLIALGAEEVFLASCSFGSIHQKEFCFLGVHMKVGLLSRPCTRDHSHVPIEGKYTKPSATYVDGLAHALAVFFADHLRAKACAVQRLSLRSSGLEDVLTNDISISSSWKAAASWRWKGASHINLLEAGATLKLFRSLAERGGDLRFVYFGDSHVARSAISRGRTSSNALKAMLKRFAALCLAFGLYPAGRYTPTRNNPADAPSRGEEIPCPVPLSLLHGLSGEKVSALARLSSLRRWIANWARLTLLLAPAIISFLAARSDFRRHPQLPVEDHEWEMDFDSTLGFPGEGPAKWFFLLGASQFLSFLCFPQAVGGVGRSHGDEQRRAARTGINLAAGRRVTETTNLTRETLYGNFLVWLGSKGLDVNEVVFANPPNIDLLNSVLCDYGRWLFSEGKPMYHFSETVNSISSRRPTLRRSMAQAWDLAFMWGSYEPVVHHLAMPIQILAAVISIAWSWGWPREAAIFALAWGALLRIGEVFQSARRDLILPSDVAGSIDYALLKIKEPKTRFRAARHQAGKLEQPDLIEVVRIGLGHLQQHEKLWPASGATLRNRLVKILEKLKLPSKAGQSPKPLSLASLRPGGATWLIAQTESAELVKRRGRWVSYRVMECYLQEAAQMPSWIFTFWRSMCNEGRKEETAKNYARTFAMLFRENQKAPSEMASQTYFELVKASPKNKSGNGQRSASVAAFQKFYNAIQGDVSKLDEPDEDAKFCQVSGEQRPRPGRKPKPPEEAQANGATKAEAKAPSAKAEAKAARVKKAEKAEDEVKGRKAKPKENKEREKIKVNSEEGFQRKTVPLKRAFELLAGPNSEAPSVRPRAVHVHGRDINKRMAQRIHGLYTEIQDEVKGGKPVFEKADHEKKTYILFNEEKKTWRMSVSMEEQGDFAKVKEPVDLPWMVTKAWKVFSESNAYEEVVQEN